MLRKTITFLTALVIGLGLTVAASSTAQASSTVTVSAAAYQTLTQARTAACSTSDQDGYHAPVAPALVQRAANSRALPSRYWRHYPGASFGAVTGNGLPTHWYTNVNKVTSYITVDGHRQQVTHRPVLHVAWVPNFDGSGCSVWTAIQYVS